MRHPAAAVRDSTETYRRLNDRGVPRAKPSPEQVSQAMALSRRRLDHQMIQEFAAATQEIYSPQMRAF